MHLLPNENILFIGEINIIWKTPIQRHLNQESSIFQHSPILSEFVCFQRYSQHASQLTETMHTVVLDIKVWKLHPNR